MPETPQQGRSAKPDYRRHRGNRRERPHIAVPLQGQAVQAAVTPRPTPSPVTKQAEPDYSYVFKDLKNISIIVGGIVVAYFVIFLFWK